MSKANEEFILSLTKLIQSMLEAMSVKNRKGSHEYNQWRTSRYNAWISLIRGNEDSRSLREEAKEVLTELDRFLEGPMQRSDRARARVNSTLIAAYQKKTGQAIAEATTLAEEKWVSPIYRAWALAIASDCLLCEYTFLKPLGSVTLNKQQSAMLTSMLEYATELGRKALKIEPKCIIGQHNQVKAKYMAGADVELCVALLKDIPDPHPTDERLVLDWHVALYKDWLNECEFRDAMAATHPKLIAGIDAIYEQRANKAGQFLEGSNRLAGPEEETKVGSPILKNFAKVVVSGLTLGASMYFGGFHASHGGSNSSKDGSASLSHVKAMDRPSDSIEAHPVGSSPSSHLSARAPTHHGNQFEGLPQQFVQAGNSMLSYLEQASNGAMDFITCDPLERTLMSRRGSALGGGRSGRGALGGGRSVQILVALGGG